MCSTARRGSGIARRARRRSWSRRPEDPHPAATLADYSIFSEVGWRIITGSRELNLDAMRAVHAETGTVPSVTLGGRDRGG